VRSAAAIMLAVVRLADLADSEGRGDEARSMLRQAVAETKDLGLPTPRRRCALVRCGRGADMSSISSNGLSCNSDIGGEFS
jgi:hypothetical protein